MNEVNGRKITSNYRGKVLTNFFINAFGGRMFTFFVISSGHWFQIFLLSLMKLFLTLLEWPTMVNVPFIWDLNVLSSLFIIGTLSLKELLFLSLFNAFHTSVIFVWAFMLNCWEFFYVLFEVSEQSLVKLFLQNSHHSF